MQFLDFFRSIEEITWDCPKWDREGLFPANPDLADILADMDLNVENFSFFIFVGFQISGFSGSQISQIWAGLGPGRAGLEPLAQKKVDCHL